MVMIDIDDVIRDAERDAGRWEVASGKQMTPEARDRYVMSTAIGRLTWYVVARMSAARLTDDHRG